MPITYQLSVLLHVLAAVVWVGGLVFIGAVAVPASRTVSEERGREMVRLLGRRFRPVGWVAFAMLIATGLYQAWVWGARPGNVLTGAFFSTARAKGLGIKVILVVSMLITSGLHDWWVGPRAAELADREADEADRWQLASGLLGAATALLGVLVVLLGAVISRAWVIDLGL